MENEQSGVIGKSEPVPPAGKTKADDIKSRFAKVGGPETAASAPQARPATANDEQAVAAIIERGQEREKNYGEEGTRRATESKKKKEQDQTAKDTEFKTTLHISRDTFKRFKRLENKLVESGASVTITYKKCFAIGLEALERMDDEKLAKQLLSTEEDLKR